VVDVHAVNATVRSRVPHLMILIPFLLLLQEPRGSSPARGPRPSMSSAARARPRTTRRARAPGSDDQATVGPGGPRHVQARPCLRPSPGWCLTLQWRGWDSGRSPGARGVENGPSGCGKEPRSLI
jgi:hypothetical protein